MENFENDVTILSAIPLLGTIPSLSRALFGLVQLVTAAVLFAFSLSDSVHDAFPHLRQYAIEHILHGGANLLWGIAMAIPLLGTSLFIAKRKKADKKANCEATPYVSMKYGTLSPSPTKKKRPQEEQTYITRLSFSLENL